MQKVCPRCSSSFECREDNILECDCISVFLSAEQLEYIAGNYTGCLCVDCLKQIKSEARQRLYASYENAQKK